MSLSSVIVKHLARIGATFPNASAGDAVRTLVREVIWPDVTFTGSIRQLRAYLMRCGEVGVGSRSDDKLREPLPLICGFRFLRPDSRGEFWDGWEGAFPCVDPAKLFPIASDDDHFYFIAANDADTSDPVVYTVDHEETDAEPYDGRLRVLCHLLAVIEAEGAPKGDVVRPGAANPLMTCEQESN